MAALFATEQPGVASEAGSPAPSLGVFAKAIDRVSIVATAGIVVVVLAQIVGRLTDRPFAWTEELTRACFIWMVFIGMAAGMRQADAARVTVLMDAMPRALRRLALPIYLLFSLGFFALMAWTGAGMVQQQVRMNESIATLGWPSWVIGMVVPVSAVVAIVCTLTSLREHRAAIALERVEDAQ